MNSHPIQYFGPVYQEMALLDEVPFRVFYLSTRGVGETFDAGFSRSYSWDVPLLSGYPFVFTAAAEKNRFREPRQLNAEGLDHLLDDWDPTDVVVHGYVGADARSAMSWARRHGRGIVMRADTWAGRGEVGGLLRRLSKRAWLRATLTGDLEACFPPGIRSAAYWERLGLPKSRIFEVPYGVDSSRFHRPGPGEYERLRERLGFSRGLPIVAYAGKLEPKKGIRALLDWWRDTGRTRLQCQFVVLGDGPELAAVARAAPHFASAIRLEGFVNQSRMPDYLRAIDLLLMPSVRAETWGFAAQEALACGAMVLASDSVGCVPDLVREGENGWVLPAEEWTLWGERLETAAYAAQERRSAAEERGPVPPTHSTSARAYLSALRSVKTL